MTMRLVNETETVQLWAHDEGYIDNLPRDYRVVAKGDSSNPPWTVSELHLGYISSVSELCDDHLLAIVQDRLDCLRKGPYAHLCAARAKEHVDSARMELKAIPDAHWVGVPGPGDDDSKKEDFLRSGKQWATDDEQEPADGPNGEFYVDHAKAAELQTSGINFSLRSLSDLERLGVLVRVIR